MAKDAANARLRRATGRKAARPAASGRDREGGPAVRPADVVGALLSGPLAEAGFDLEAVVVTRAGSRYVVAVAVDRDGALDLDAVAEASRVVSDVMDAHDDELPISLRSAYTLEVSSRGATAPLTLPRHWRRAVGRLVEVRRRGGLGQLTGRIVASDETGVDLEVATGRAVAAVRVDYVDVAKAVIELEFRRPPGLGGGDDLDDPDDTDELDDDGDAPDEEETSP